MTSRPHVVGVEASCSGIAFPTGIVWGGAPANFAFHATQLWRSCSDCFPRWLRYRWRAVLDRASRKGRGEHVRSRGFFLIPQALCE